MNYMTRKIDWEEWLDQSLRALRYTRPSGCIVFLMCFESGANRGAVAPF